MSKKKILLLSDDMTSPSGVGVMSKEIILGTVDQFDWVQMAGSIKHPQKGKIFDMSESINKTKNISDAYVKLYPVDGYGNQQILREVMAIEKPDAILHFTDPRQWIWLYQMEHEIRQTCPLIYYHVWDNLPYPHWNKPYYDSCDLVMCISKLTHNIVRYLTKDSDTHTAYVPHGVNSEVFKPLDSTENQLVLGDMRDRLFGDDVPEFVAFFNNRNIKRKNVPDIMHGFDLFRSSLPKSKQDKVALLMHTKPDDPNGTNLTEIKNKLFPESRIVIHDKNVEPIQLNLLYNISDVTINAAYAEGFGLSNLESMMAGTMTITNTTGGLQDQCRFSDSAGDWIDFSEEFPTNHTQRFENTGSWVVSMKPELTKIVGGQPTPYIYEDHVGPGKIQKALEHVYNIKPERRKEFGLDGREWALGQESMMSSKSMCSNIKYYINKLIENWKKPEPYKLINNNKQDINSNYKTGIIYD